MSDPLRPPGFRGPPGARCEYSWMMMEQPTRIRPAKPADAATLAVLAGELGYAVTFGQMQARLAETSDASRYGVYVAERDSVVGWIQVSVVVSLESGETAEIRGLVVDEAHRSEGIGGALVAAAEQWARERGLSRIRVRTNVTRERTQQFYRKLSFRSAKKQEVFDKDLLAGR